MIDTQAVRSMLLDKAIHGELSENRSTDADTQDILNSISAERTKLIKLKKTKIGKNVPRLDVELFDLPKGWKWVALGDLCIMLSRGKSPTYSENSIYPVFAQKCNQPTALALEKAKFLDETTVEKWPDYFRLRDHDVVINSTGTGTVGRIGYYTKETLASKYPYMLPDSHVTVARMGTGIISKYIYYVLKSDFLQRIIESQLRGSTNQKEYYIDSVYGTPIPLPSTVEQQEIVQKLDKAYFELTNIDNLQTDYANNIISLNKKILDLAVRGKLVPQDPNDEPASVLLKKIAKEKQELIKEGKIKKQKVLPAITEEEIPFDIPESWEWVRLEDVTKSITDGDHQAPPQTETGISFLVISNVSSGFMDFSNTRHVPEEYFEKLSADRKPAKGDILFTVTGSYGIPMKVETEQEFCFQRHIALIKPMIDANFLVMLLKSPLVKDQCDRVATGTAQKTVGLGSLRNILVPIPPVNEQIRILETLKHTIPLTESLS